MQIYERFLELFKSIKTGCNGGGPPKNKVGKKGNTLPLPLYYLQKKRDSRAFPFHKRDAVVVHCNLSVVRVSAQVNRT
jgi:hypothetical protein